MELLPDELLNDEILKPFIAKSYFDEKSRIKQEMISLELEEIIDMDSLEAGQWSFDDNEWMLKGGKTADDVLRLLLKKNIAHTRDLVKFSLLAIENDGLITRQNGKAFDSSIMLSLPPIAFIKDLLTCDYLSLFDCIFLVGYINDNNERIISHSIDIAAYAITNAVISPRDPRTYLKFNNSTKRRLTGEFIYPDLSWLLTFEEAEQWCVNSFAVSLKATRDKLAAEPPANTKKTTENNEQAVTDTKPPYLDEKHPMFSRELFIAIEAWKQVLSSNPSKPKTGSRKSLILAWLEENHKELTTQAKERIATMINPDSNGGTPKTPAL